MQVVPPATPPPSDGRPAGPASPAGLEPSPHLRLIAIYGAIGTAILLIGYAAFAAVTSAGPNAMQTQGGRDISRTPAVTATP